MASLEGVVTQDLNGGIKILVRKGWFSIEDYNRRLSNFKFWSYEASDRPQELTEKSKKLPGKACSIWVHIRNFPLLISNLVKDDQDEVLALLLLLSDITARVTAMEFREHEIDALELLILEYLDARKSIFEEFPDIIGTPKPKHHFITHYSQAIRLFGPPMAYWTGRFESKHR